MMRRMENEEGRKGRNVDVHRLSLQLMATLFVIASTGEGVYGSVDAYEELESYGFPSGLLPHTVTSYDLAENGKFAVYLDSKCEVDIPSAFPVVYAQKISGQLSYGRLTGLSGISVKIYFFWLNIDKISVTGESLKFEVGVISSTYPIHPNFDENPICVNTLISDSPLLLNQ